MGCIPIYCRNGKHRVHRLIPSLKNRLAANKNVLELGCCTFRFEKLPK